MINYTVADYLIERLSELGASHLFHVPGNYTAQFLSRAQASGRLSCVGTINELEAGYAADAYARLKPIGVACVTYGVGSFSLYNALAGSYVERCPVVLINGSANADKAEALVKHGVLFAHAIDTLRTDESIFKPITCATAVIVDPADAPRQIDRVLSACFAQKKPVYLEVRDGVWLLPCAQPVQPLKVAEPDAPTAARLDAAAQAAAQRIRERVLESSHPILWGGEELQRLGLEGLFEELVAATGLKYTTTLMAKSLMGESSPNSPQQQRPEFLGVYDSKFAPPAVRQVVEGSDCIVALGTILADFYGDIVSKSHDSMILAAGGAVRVGREIFPGVDLSRLMRELVRLFRAKSLRKSPPDGADALGRSHLVMMGDAVADAAEGPGEMSWHDAFRVIDETVDPDTYVLADTTLGLFLAAETLIAKPKHFVAQTAWLSIGYAVGAATGVATLLESHEHALVLAGDGGFQMVAQSLATLVKLRKPVTLLVFDNALYAIEQYLVNHRYFAQDNPAPADFFCELDLDPSEPSGTTKRRWDYVRFAEALGAVGRLACSPAQLAEALTEARARRDGPTLIAARIASRALPKELVVSQPVALMGDAAETGHAPHDTPATLAIPAAGFN
jgi:indolepyruvate decarboxylase